MRKFLALALVAFLALSSAFALTGCGQQQQPEQAPEQSMETTPTDTTMGGMDTTAADTSMQH